MRIFEWRKIANKIAGMDGRELRDRSRQEIQKRWDTLLARTHHDFTKNAFAGESGQAGSFFFKPSQVDEIISLMRQRVPQAVSQIVVKADRILAHRFDLLGFEDLEYGAQIDWHFDAVHGKRAPLKPFYAINYLDFAEVGDSKVTWELNRHQHLVTLAKAFRLTNDRRYTDELVGQWRDWQSSNPYSFGINWASSLELGFRSLSWIWCYHLIDGTAAMTEDFRREWLRAQVLHGRHIERYLSTYFSPNTHVLGEGVALFFLGILCPELTRAQRWKDLGWQIILREAQRQVLDDGMHFEHSTYYHVYALDLLLHATILATMNSVPVPPDLENTVEKMLDALFLVRSGGSPPMFGDDDGGRVFDPVRNRADHFSDPLAVGAILFNRADFKSLLRIPTEESIWLLGAAGASRWDGLEAKPIQSCSTALPAAGIYFLSNRSGTLTVRNGPSGGQSRGHDHADALSICLQASGRALLIDPGTYEYVGPDDQRNVFRGTAMHNTLQVDGKDQCEPDGPFSWKQNVRSHAEKWVQGEHFDLFVGSHDGYQRLVSSVLHRRWIVGMNGGLFLVRDVVEGEGEHQLDLFWHLGPDLVVHCENVFRVKDTIRGLAFLHPENHGWSVSVHRGAWSPVYGKQSSAIVLNYGKRTGLPAEFISVLIPLEDISSDAGKIAFSRISAVGTAVNAYQYRSQDLQHRFYLSSAPRAWKSEDVSSDAEFVCVTSRSDGDPVAVVFCDGTYVQIAGSHHFRTKRNVQRFEWTPKGVSCSDAEAIVLATEAVMKSESAEQPE
jgi:hypothetical protein